MLSPEQREKKRIRERNRYLKNKELYKSGEKPIPLCREKLANLPEEERLRRVEYHRNYRKNNRAKEAVYYREYRKKHPERCRNYGKKWRSKNPDKVRALDRRTKQRNRKRINAQALARQKKNKAYVCMNSNNYRALKKSLTPPDANRKIILTIYQIAIRVSQCCGIKFQVDHIVPLVRKGLHHHANLQVIPATLNHKKHDRLMSEILHLSEFRDTYLAVA